MVVNDVQMKIWAFNPALQEEFCAQIGADDLDVWKDHIVALKEEEIECYYGHRLIEPVIIKEFSYEFIYAWMDSLREFCDFMAISSMKELRDLQEQKELKPIITEIDEVEFDSWLDYMLGLADDYASNC